MLGNFEFLGNFAVLHAVRNQADDIFLASRQQRSVLGIIEVQRFNVGEGVDQMFEVFVARPDFSLETYRLLPQESLLPHQRYRLL